MRTTSKCFAVATALVSCTATARAHCDALDGHFAEAEVHAAEK